MNVRLAARDIHALRTIADHRILAVHHLAVLEHRNLQALRRRLTKLEEAGFILMMPSRFGGSRGRPERLLSLTDKGADALKDSGILKPDVANELATCEGIRCVQHHLLVNDFRVQLAQMQRLAPALTVEFLCPLSPFMSRSEEGHSSVRERVEHPDRPGELVSFTPDGVFSVTHADPSRTLLFFLEVDMDTETLVSSKRTGRDIRQKIANYQTYFKLQRYRRYEKLWRCELKGFRLLFLVRGARRMAALCRVVRERPPSDFIWVADDGSLLASGVWASIWARGGRADKTRESILGSQGLQPSPAPDEMLAADRS